MYQADHRWSLGMAPTYRGAVEARSWDDSPDMLPGATRRTFQLDLEDIPTTDTPRVVLVDDDDKLRHTVGELLEEVGIRVVGEASNADIASRVIPLAAQTAPVVALVDVRMPPGRNGIELTRELVASGVGCKVIVFTAFPDPEIERAARAAGAVGFLVKGSGAKEILNVLHAVWAAVQLERAGG